MKTKDRILFGSLELFNFHGATDVTTNDISKHLKMSPGNLYFHYKNKEQIIREIFKKLSAETIEVWQPETKLAKKKQKMQLALFIDKNLNLYWKYRFFHREIYSLRKNDSDLAKMWKVHTKKLSVMMVMLYRQWVKSGFMIAMPSKAEMEFIGELLFVSSNGFMQFYDSPEKSETLNSKTLEKTKKHIMRLLMPYVTGETKDEFEKNIKP